MTADLVPSGAEPVPPEVWSSEAFVRRQIELLEDGLTQVLFGNYSAVVETEGGDPLWGGLAMHINVVLNAVREAIARAEKSEALAEMRHQVEQRNAQLQDALAALEDQNRQIREADRLRRDMFATLTHEFRTPLTLCLAPLAALLAGEAGPITDRQQYLVEVVRSSASKLLALINGLLDLARLDADAFTVRQERFDAAAMLEKLVHTFGPTAESRGLSLELHLPKRLAPASADPVLMEKVFTNLLSNAIKFTPSGGKVRIAAGAQGSRLCIVVKDSGIGIPAGELGHIFERFRQVDSSLSRKYEGSGIGLALVREFLERMHGSVVVRSAVGKGTTFRVHVPLDPDRASAPSLPPPAPMAGSVEVLPDVLTPLRKRRAQAKRSSNDSLPVDRPRLLLAEDSDELAEFISSLLGEDYVIERANNGDEAFARIRAFRPDVILSDVMMPGSDGFSLCRAVKNDPELTAIPVMLLTAQGDRDFVIAGWEAGADEYLLKPFEPHELRVRVRSLIRLRASHRALALRTAELEQVNKKLLETQAQMVQSAKLAAVGQLAAGVAHELNNPLTTILGFSQALARTIPDDDSPESLAAHSIVREARRARDLIQDILTVARASSSEKVPVAMEHVLKRIQTLCEPRARIQGARLEVEDACAMPQVVADPRRIEQVFVNLVNNGLDAAGQGGVVEVSVEVESSGLAVRISDNGPGVPPEIMDRIFEPFFTTKAPGKGTGLGLALSYEIVRSHGGSLEVTNRPSGGACFTVRLPIHQLERCA